MHRECSLLYCLQHSLASFFVFHRCPLHLSQQLLGTKAALPLRTHGQRQPLTPQSGCSDSVFALSTRVQGVTAVQNDWQASMPGLLVWHTLNWQNRSERIQFSQLKTPQATLLSPAREHFQGLENPEHKLKPILSLRYRIQQNYEIFSGINFDSDRPVKQKTTPFFCCCGLLYCMKQFLYKL